MHLMYLLLAVIMLIPAIAGAIVRPDLRRPILLAGIVGGFIEAISEIWYLRDYWDPPTLLPWPTIEDLIYGFGVTATAVIAYPVVFRRRFSTDRPQRDRRTWLPLLLVAFVIVMTLAQWLTDINSIWTAIGCFAVGGLFAIGLRRDLVGPAVSTAVVMGLIAAVGYAIGLNWLIDGEAYLEKYYLLNGSDWGIKVLGNVPLDEIVWNITRGLCMGAMYPFLGGRTFTLQ